MLPYINAPFVYVAGKLGAAPDELKLIFSFLLSYPLAGVLKRIPDSKPAQKNAFIIAVSMFYLVGLFDLWAGLRTILISSVGAYSIAAYIQGPYMPWVGFVFLMGHMSVNHIYRQIVNDPSSVDITGAQMVLVMKLTAFCWNVYDGTLPEATLTDHQKDRALKQLPGLLDYAGFVLFFPSLFAGPAFDFVDYRRWIETTMFELPAGVDPSKAPPTRKQRKIPRSGTPAAWKAAFGLLWIFAFLQFSGYYYTDFLLSDGYKQYGLFRRVWVLHMLGVTTRMKYYGVWSLTEGACILSGIGFKGIDPKTGKADWNRLQNVKPLEIELAQNSHAYLGNWNINTNMWLRNYIYLRVTPKGKKPGFRASMATFVTSAFWHGFYPGYYLAFVLASFIQNSAKNSRRLIRPFFMSADGTKALPSKRYYDIFTWLCTQLAFSFTVAPFIFLGFSSSLLIWQRVYFYTIIGVTASSLFLLSPGKQFLQQKVKQHSQPSEEQIKAELEKEGKIPTLGLPDDPGRAWDEMVEEIVAEIQERKRKGLPIPAKLRQDAEKIGKKVA
ncbi:MBOAT family protein-like protein [Aureobasidium sp. EXF-12298]|nr:MBOAT family protein-like protein [Aureobasidium sp. EXF-12298]KAI4752182.1 MBOAT family protein-like protein [Aureobasidium sp. EXF-12344]KAI4768870.1 MBOAT family protein-like protein [Aureobasidium sp. EXF-3400]